MSSVCIQTFSGNISRVPPILLLLSSSQTHTLTYTYLHHHPSRPVQRAEPLSKQIDVHTRMPASGRSTKPHNPPPSRTQYSRLQSQIQNTPLQPQDLPPPTLSLPPIRAPSPSPPYGPLRDASIESIDEVDWSLVPALHTSSASISSAGLEVGECWNCTSPLLATSLHICPECRFPN
jgi:hypothetical protein